MAFIEQLPSWMNRDLIAGNSGGQIVGFFLCVLVTWLLARLIKVWIERLAKNPRWSPPRFVFFSSVGKSFPLFGIWGVSV